MEEQIINILKRINGLVDKIPELYITIRNQLLIYEFTSNVTGWMTIILVILALSAGVLFMWICAQDEEITDTDYEYEEPYRKGEFSDTDELETYYIKRQDDEDMQTLIKLKRWFKCVIIGFIVLLIIKCVVVYVQYKTASDVTFIMEYVRNSIPKQ